MGEPTQRVMASIVRFVALLSKGACSSAPTTGRSHVVIVLDATAQG